MVKGILSIVIFVFFVILGYSYGEIYRKRPSDLKEWNKAILFLQNEILYNNTPIPIALNNVGVKVSEPIKKVFLSLSSNLKNNNINSLSAEFYKVYIDNKLEFYLNEDDEVIIRDFFKGIQESTSYGIDKVFNLTLENLKINISDSEELAKKNTKLYRSLGLCVGAMISILII